MYGGLGMSAPSLHRESTDSLITLAMYFRQFVSVIGYIVTRKRWSDT